jgi:hypothetical protein
MGAQHGCTEAASDPKAHGCLRRMACGLDKMRRGRGEQSGYGTSAVVFRWPPEDPGSCRPGRGKPVAPDLRRQRDPRVLARQIYQANAYT